MWVAVFSKLIVLNSSKLLFYDPGLALSLPWTLLMTAIERSVPDLKVFLPFRWLLSLLVIGLSTTRLEALRPPTVINPVYGLILPCWTVPY